MGASHIVILTGAGISAESGLSTFRDKGGLWAKYDIADVATPEGFARDPRMVLDFYNARRIKCRGVVPNAAHAAIARFFAAYDVGFDTGEWGEMLGLCSPECVFDDRRRAALVSGGIEMLIASARERAAMRARPTHRHRICRHRAPPLRSLCQLRRRASGQAPRAFRKHRPGRQHHHSSLGRSWLAFGRTRDLGQARSL